jgi:hyperpolarization activated cyclic nucleotide-gated potassium channel 2
MTVGYGDIPAKTMGEMLLALMWMIFGSGFYQFLIGNFTSIIKNNI